MSMKKSFRSGERRLCLDCHGGRQCGGGRDTGRRSEAPRCLARHEWRSVPFLPSLACVALFKRDGGHGGRTCIRPPGLPDGYPVGRLPTGVNQLTVFDGEGRIYADRLFFVNHHDYDARNWPFPASASPMNLSIPSPCICNWPTRRIPYPAFPLPFATGIRKKTRTTMARYSPKCSLPVKSKGLWSSRVIISGQSTVFAAKASSGS